MSSAKELAMGSMDICSEVLSLDSRLAQEKDIILLSFGGPGNARADGTCFGSAR